MSSYRQMYYHITFGTYERRPVLSPDHREDFLKFAWEVINAANSKLYRINAVEDHLHMLVAIHPNVAVSEFIRDFKVATNRWVKERELFPDFDHWQEGYGLFTVSHSEKDRLIRYIKNQQEHHRKESFREEFERLLKEAEIEYEDRFLP